MIESRRAAADVATEDGSICWERLESCRSTAGDSTDGRPAPELRRVTEPCRRGATAAAAAWGCCSATAGMSSSAGALLVTEPCRTAAEGSTGVILIASLHP